MARSGRKTGWFDTNNNNSNSQRISRESKRPTGIGSFVRRQTKLELVILFQLACMGSSEALDLFLRGCLAILLKWTWKSEEAASDAWSHVATHWQQFDPAKSNLSTWLRQSARAGWLMSKRKNHLDREVQLTEDQDGKDQWDKIIDQRSCSVDHQEQIENLLEVCSQQDMEVLSMYFVDGLTLRQIADKLDVSAPTARKMILDTINRIRQTYGQTDKVVGLNKRAGCKLEMDLEVQNA